MTRRAPIEEPRRLVDPERCESVDGGHRPEPADLARRTAQLRDTPVASTTEGDRYEMERRSEAGEAPTDVPVAERLAALRREYGEGLSARVDAIALALETACGSNDDSGLSTVLRLAHRLHGTAGTYGFPRVGEAAGRLEELARGVMASGATAADWGSLSAGLAELQAAVSAGARQPERQVRSRL